jgi:hypothetical protein
MKRFISVSVGETTVERLQVETGDIEEPEPLVLRRPPDGARRAVVEGDVDAVVAHRVPGRVRYRLVLVLAVEARGDPVVEGKGVPGEPPFLPERGGDALEGAAAVGPGRQVQERAERAVDQRRRLVESVIGPWSHASAGESRAAPASVTTLGPPPGPRSTGDLS